MERLIGILGGTFDPPHLGHLILAQAALDALKLAQVLFLPVADPPHKHDRSLTSVEHRLAMVTAAIADNPRFALSRVDLDRPGPHYTVDTLAILTHTYPDAALYFLMGGDSLHDLLTWRDPGGIVAQAYLAVMRRPGSTFDLSGLAARIPEIERRVVFVDAPEIGISATTLRERLRADHSIRYQVPDAVERYILSHKLYRI